ncbi:MAG: DNA topoisomerase IV [Candidatus Amoebophilus sp. 36-38]|nr:MAG: DNA topoisomerase IV [Candidatus Amoebophilus sp. 36-38]
MSEELIPNNAVPHTNIHELTPIGNMYQNWFLDYASYVILERAVPAIEDGLKPVQRRILHAMKEMDDGRYNKVANIIGQTMQYHPHGDASIAEAIINLGQKELLIDTQGNWGDIRTGDSAAAARYIEARPSALAHAILYSPQITNWQLSYDGRKKEPLTFPVKFPLLLAQGVEGIAVGLATKILPHNFCELLEGSIAILQGKTSTLFPDFPTSGLIDCSAYNEGKRGGRIRLRARIETVDKKTLAIREIPYGTTTSSIIDSIIRAYERGKIKIKQVIDNTAQDVEILVHLAPGQSPDVVIDALYVFTECEVSISPNTCVIMDGKPIFIGVNELLAYNTQRTKDILGQELTLQHQALQEKILFASLEKIFIEKRIYRNIEESETWEAVLKTIDQGLTPYKKQFYRDITEEDLIRLTEIKIKRISKYDSQKADDMLQLLEKELVEIKHHLKNLTTYTIQYFKDLLKKYGRGRERKTEIRTFDTIEAHAVVASNQKLYINRKQGFIGYGLKKDEFISDCSDLDDIIVFRKDGKCLVVKIAEKVFVGKDIIHVAIYKKNDERRVYNMIYVDGKTGIARAKRFQMIGIIRDKEYELTTGKEGSRIVYLTDNPNGNAEIVTLILSPNSKARNKIFDFDFASLQIKGRNSQGNIVTKYTIKKIQLKVAGQSTLGALEIWYDEHIGKLNTEARGKSLGTFQEEDRVLVIYQGGYYMLTNYALSNHYEPDQVLVLEKFDPNCTVSVVYYDGKTKQYYVKRFHIETTLADKKFNFISEAKNSKLILATTILTPQINIGYKVSANQSAQSIVYDLGDIPVKGWKTVGSKLSKYTITSVTLSSTEK